MKFLNQILGIHSLRPQRYNDIDIGYANVLSDEETTQKIEGYRDVVLHITTKMQY